LASPTQDDEELSYRADDEAAPGISPGVEPGETNAGNDSRSLLEDIEYLIADARIWMDAEMSFQKSRVSLVLNRIKIVVAAGAIAVLMAMLALIGLTVGLIIALTPLITAWGATAVVVLILLLVAWLLVKRAAFAIREIQAATRTEATSDEAEE